MLESSWGRSRNPKAMSVRRIRTTFASSSASVTIPFSNRGFSVSSFMQKPRGISKSTPSCITSTGEYVDVQSDIVNPLKCQSSRSVFPIR